MLPRTVVPPAVDVGDRQNRLKCREPIKHREIDGIADDDAISDVIGCWYTEPLFRSMTLDVELLEVVRP